MKQKPTYCSNCGAQVYSNDRFCTGCGHPVPPVIPPRRSYRWIAIGLGIFGCLAALLIIISLLIILAIIGGRDDPRGKLVLDPAQPLVSRSIPSGGGRIVAGDPKSALPGLELTVPGGAYAGSTDFRISTAVIRSHTFGRLFNPASPLITVENDHQYATRPMTIRIPVHISEGEFVMGFFYDRSTGLLEGIPCVAQDGQSITLATAHFSDIVLTRTRIAELDQMVKKAPLDTGFKPGEDDFYAPNYGSWARPTGHCAGQSIAAIHYYNTYGSGGKRLRTEPMIDNNQYDATPELFWDDALGMRLSSRVQIRVARAWAGNYDYFRNVDEDLTYYRFLNAIAQTHAPQLIEIRTPDYIYGHAMVVYKVSRDAIWVADPNYPGDLERKITVTRWLDPDKDREVIKLGAYTTKQDAEGKTRQYTWMAYYGVYSLVNKAELDRDWQLVLKGQDPAARIFPPRLTYEVITGVDDGGRSVIKRLEPNVPLTVNAGDLARVTPLFADQNIIFLRHVGTAYGKWRFYLGDRNVKAQEFSIQKGHWNGIALKPGTNDMGILFLRLQYNDGEYNPEFDDFLRFQVILDKKKRPDEADACTGTWKPTAFTVTSFQGGSARFWEDIKTSNPQSTPVKYGQWYLSQWCRFFANSEAPDGTPYYHHEISIGPPPRGSSEAWTGKTLFQTNVAADVESSHLTVEVDGREYSQLITLPARAGGGRLHVEGYASAVDRRGSFYYAMNFVRKDEKTMQGEGTIKYSLPESGAFIARFTCTLVRTSKKAHVSPVVYTPLQ